MNQEEITKNENIFIKELRRFIANLQNVQANIFSQISFVSLNIKPTAILSPPLKKKVVHPRFSRF